MLKPHLFLKPNRETTRLYLTIGARELLRTVLPPPGPYFQTRSAPLLLEGLALWLQRPLSVVLCAADGDDSSALGFYHVALRSPHGAPVHMHMRHGDEQANFRSLLALSDGPEDKTKLDPWWSVYCAAGTSVCD